MRSWPFCKGVLPALMLAASLSLDSNAWVQEDAFEFLTRHLSQLPESERNARVRDLQALYQSLPTVDLRRQADARVRTWCQSLSNRLPDDAPYLALRTVHADLPEIAIPPSVRSRNQALLCEIIKTELNNALRSTSIASDTKEQIRSQMNALTEYAIAQVAGKTSHPVLTLVARVQLEQQRDDTLLAASSPFSGYDRPLSEPEIQSIQEAIQERGEAITYPDLQELSLSQAVVDKYRDLPPERGRQFLILQLTQTGKERRDAYTSASKALQPLSAVFRAIPKALNTALNDVFKTYDELVVGTYADWNESLKLHGDRYYKIWGSNIPPPTDSKTVPKSEGAGPPADSASRSPAPGHEGKDAGPRNRGWVYLPAFAVLGGVIAVAVVLSRRHKKRSPSARGSE